MNNLWDYDFLTQSGKHLDVCLASKTQGGIQYMRDQNDIQPDRMASYRQLGLVTDI
jgi:hypothetical protein